MDDARSSTHLEAVAENRPRTWRAGSGALKTPALALLSAALLAGACEILARTDVAAHVLGPPSYGTRLRFFDLQMARLQTHARAGGVDCVFLGSSAVLHALDPRAFAAAYERKAGRRPRCFNFGLPGATVADVQALGRILTRDYRVDMLVYAITPRDVGQGALGPLLNESPWVKRRVTKLNFDGYLTEASTAFRYFLLFRRWLEPGRPEAFVGFPVREDGFFPAERTLDAGAFLTGWELGILKQGGRYEVRAFSGLVDLEKLGVDVVVAEIPRAPALARLEHAPDVAVRQVRAYEAFRSQVAAKAGGAGGVFIEAPPDDIVAGDGWADLVHMNARGAESFSSWLGARTAEVGAGNAVVARDGAGS
jgi:hypothetical protein